MRAYLINPTEQTITEVNLMKGRDSKATVAEIYRLMNCHRVTTGSRPLVGSLSQGFDHVLANDDDLLEPGEDESIRDHWQKDPRHWYQVDADWATPSSFPLSGKGLVVGVDEHGERCDARISLGELKARISFTRRKFQGFEVKTTRSGISIIAKVPLIDGQNE